MADTEVTPGEQGMEAGAGTLGGGTAAPDHESQNHTPGGGETAPTTGNPPLADGDNGETEDTSPVGGAVEQGAELDPAVTTLLGAADLEESDYRAMEGAMGKAGALAWLDRVITARMDKALKAGGDEDAGQKPEAQAKPDAATQKAAQADAKAASKKIEEAPAGEAVDEAEAVVEQIREEYGDFLAEKIGRTLMDQAKKLDAMSTRFESVSAYVQMQQDQDYRKGFDTVVEQITKDNPAFAKQVEAMIGKSWTPKTKAARENIASRAVQIFELTRARTGMVIPAGLALRRAFEEANNQPLTENQALAKIRSQVQNRSAMRQVPPSAGRASTGTGPGGQMEVDPLAEAKAHIRKTLAQIKANPD